MTLQRKLSYASQNNRGFVISEGSHLFIKNAEKNGVYWEWQKIPVPHDVLREILSQGEESLDRIRQMLPDLPKTEIKRIPDAGSWTFL